MPRYTQGLMDLGAGICLTRNPSCLLCPVRELCAARREGTPEKYPVKTRKLKRSAHSLWLLLARARDGAVWLEKRPAPGIWAGLYCLPAFESRDALEAAVPAEGRARLLDHAPFLHVLTHKDLHLHSVTGEFAKWRRVRWREHGRLVPQADEWAEAGIARAGAQAAGSRAA